MKQGEEPTLDARLLQRSDKTAFGPDPATIPPDASRPPGETTELPVIEPSNYKLLGEHARGGMGRVLIARDERLGRLVAIKELLAGEKDLALRFLREVLLTARLQHPSIVPIHEAGRWPNGKPFYAMKLVSGRPLGELIRAAETLADRLALLRHIIAVADAIAYAHSVRIIHRDLKPSNVIVGEFGETVVIDWGLAKDISNSEGTAPDRMSAHTVQGAVVGTPGYMPPEQAFGRTVDERADVYALGSLLYTVLAGRPPYEGLHAPDLVAQVKAGSPVPLPHRDKEIPPDLVAIVDKAMARDPGARYPSARELAEDLKRFETGQLVAARAYSRTELLRRWLRRNRFVVGVIAAAVAVVVAMGVLSVMRIVTERDRADRERSEAVFERQRAEAAREREAARVDELTLAQARAQVEGDPTGALAWLKRLHPRADTAPAARQIAAEAYARGAARLVLADHDGGVTDVAFSPAGGFVAVGTAGGTVKLWNLSTGEGQVLRGQAGSVRRVRFSPDGRQVAAASGDKLVRVWDVGSGTPRTLAGHTDVVEDVAYAPDGTVLASAGRDGTIRLWNAATSQPAATIAVGAPARLIAFSPDGKRLVARVSDGLVAAVRDGPSLPLEASTGFASRGRFAFDADGKRVAAAAGKQIAVWDPTTGKRLRAYPVGTTVDMVAFSPDGRRIATAAEHGRVTLLDVAGGEETELVESGNDPALDVAFSPDGRYVAATHGPGTRLWNLATGDMRKLRSHTLAVVRVAFAADGRQVATASLDGTVRVWPVAQGEPQVTRLAGRPATFAASADGGRVAIAHGDGVWLGEPNGAGALLAGSRPAARRVVLSGDGRFLAAAGEDATVQVWDLSSGRDVALAGHTAPVTEVAFSPDGTRVATAGGDSSVRVWDVGTARATVLSGHQSAVTGLAYPIDGTVVSAGDDTTVRVWDVAAGSGRVLRGHEAGVTRLLAQKGAIASYGRDRQLRVWDAAAGTGRVLRLVPAVGDMAFSPSGGHLAVSEFGERQVHVWDGERMRSYLEQKPVARLAFLDENILVVGGTDGALWLRGRGDPVPLLGHKTAVAALSVVRGRAVTIVSLGEDGTLRLWTDPVPADAAALQGWLQTVTNARMDDDRVVGR